MLIVKPWVIILSDLYLSSTCAHAKSLIHDHFIAMHQRGFWLIHLEMLSVKFYPVDFQTFNSHVSIVWFFWCWKCTLKVSVHKALNWNNVKWTQRCRIQIDNWCWDFVFDCCEGNKCRIIWPEGSHLKEAPHQRPWSLNYFRLCTLFNKRTTDASF